MDARHEEPVEREELPPAEQEDFREEEEAPTSSYAPAPPEPEPETKRPEREPRRETYAPPPEKPEPPATLQEAIDRVSDIVEALRRSLDDMEEMLELLEVLERQTGADEREIESLRRALRQMHRPQEREREHHRRRS